MPDTDASSAVSYVAEYDEVGAGRMMDLNFRPNFARYLESLSVLFDDFLDLRDTANSFLAASAIDSDARQTVMRFVKYLAKFVREGVLTEELLKAKVNVEALKKAKVFPFRLYTAYCAIVREQLSLARWVNIYLEKVIDDYAKAYDWSAFGNGKWVIAPDVSGSMTSPIGASSELSYAAVSGMFVGFFLKGLEDVTVLPWSTQVCSYGVAASDPVMAHINAIMSMVNGGTHMETSIKYMLRRHIETDYAVFLTDTEEYGSGWLAAWKEYHRKYPKAVAFVLRGDSYKTSPIPEAVAAELNVYQIFGWNDSVIDYMKFVITKRKAAA